MKAKHCLLCRSEKVGYQNGLLSNKIDGVQVELRLCPKDKNRKKEAWVKAEGKLKRLEKACYRGRNLPEETCLLCQGSGQLSSGQCWWCKGRGSIKPNLLSVQLQLIIDAKAK